MALRNTGNKLMTVLTVNISQNGSQVDSLGYDITSDFGTYAAITDAQLQKLSDTDYDARFSAWGTYVQADVLARYPESGYVFNHVGRSTDVDTCKI